MAEKGWTLEDYRAAGERLMKELIQEAKAEEGALVVVGCSTSEIVGKKIGTQPAPEIAAALVKGMLPPLHEAGLFLAAQCCEHLNRTIIVEEYALRLHGLHRVNVIPQVEAGGAFATEIWKAFLSPVAVQGIEAAAGIDIGGTLIGMHLRQVAVPVRLTDRVVGEAPVIAARTRPAFAGGERALYDASLM